jgi:hypothetical protein
LLFFIVVYDQGLLLFNFHFFPLNLSINCCIYYEVGCSGIPVWILERIAEEEKLIDVVKVDFSSDAIEKYREEHKD